MLLYGDTDGFGRVIAVCTYTGVHTVDKIGAALSTRADNKLLLSYTIAGTSNIGVHAGVRRLFPAEAGTTDTHTVLSTGVDAKTAGVHVARDVGACPALTLACFVHGGEIYKLPVASSSTLSFS